MTTTAKLDILVLQGTPLDPGAFRNAPTEPCAARLYRNDMAVNADGSRHLRFIDVTAASGLCSHGYGMGVATGDFDNDGCVDVFITHFGAPNQLFRNNCDGTFTDVTKAAGVAGKGGWGMSATFFDYDRDGFLDLYVTNYVDFTIAGKRAMFQQRRRARLVYTRRLQERSRYSLPQPWRWNVRGRVRKIRDNASVRRCDGRRCGGLQ